MLLFYILLVTLGSCSTDYLQHPVTSCSVGDVVQNDCNKCVCTSKTIFECTPLECNSTKISKQKNIGTCQPNQLYAQGLLSCICTKDGKWPHKSCHETFQALPEKAVIKFKCEPHSYTIIDCNVCKCGPNGDVLPNRCTKNICNEESNRRMAGKSDMYGNCQINNWYSLAPCQFCFCAHENRLVCNTGNRYSKNIELGSYNLVVCGKELIRDALELVPSNEKVLRLGVAEESDVIPTTNAPLKVHHTTTGVDKNEPHLMKPQAAAVNVGNASDYEYYTDTEDKKVQSYPKISLFVEKDVVSTQNPYQEGDEMNNDNDYENYKNDDDETSNEVDVEMLTVKTPKHLQAKIVNTGGNHEQFNNETTSTNSNTIKINLPKVLNRVFQMALRKSMVSLNSESKCTPGTTAMKACNMCFCLKNSKLLCTTNRCD